MSKKGILVVISGFSGAGKGTVMKGLMERYPDYALSISATTRSPRKGEQEGIHYFFKTEPEFEQMIENREFIEYARYVDHFYGTPKRYVEEQLETGKDVILEIELQGALEVKRKHPETLLLFVTPPDAKELVKRLKGRGTESDEQIRHRLARAVEESKCMEQYDYIVVNDDIDTCVTHIHEMIQVQHDANIHQKEFISGIREELKEEF